MERVYNFSSGPAILPFEVLETAKEELLNYKGTGMSVLEMSHRSSTYLSIIEETEKDLREIMNIPDNYHVLFLQGGASLQFAMVPMNIMVKNKKADYVNTGVWSANAIKEAKRFGSVNVIASSEDKQFTYYPKVTSDMISKDADYVHITTNNTIYGTRCANIPDTKDVPLIADCSSNIMSEKMDINKFGLIYAGAQKNLGPAGLTVVVIREDLAANIPSDLPTMLSYKTHIEKGSMFNTPPTYSIYIMGLVMKWVKKQGGVEAIEKMNKEKAAMLYDAIDQSVLFKAPAAKEDRSLTNVVFVTGNPDLDKKFVNEAKKEGLVTLNGHRSVGGLRASLYNAMPLDGVKALVEFIKKFDKENS
ncbi:MAG: 3-phosphoserine/phosphohydroxythreonine transaminase [Clostridia bacterium]|jgi:phosphoserine aminotransferase|nr:3-phosphoserine/phosphohydroxythreonine transaminase [Clostridiaceae bacterium]